MARRQRRISPFALFWGCALALLATWLLALAFVAVFRPGITDQGGDLPVTVVNDSGVEVVVAQHFTDPQSGQDEAGGVEVTIPAGQSRRFYLLGHPGECGNGRLVAVHGTETIASIDKPCSGATWRLIADASPSGS